MAKDPDEEINIEKMISKGENEKTEFKNHDILGNNEKLAEKISGFANKLDNEGGVLLIGINDDKTYNRLEFNKDDEEKIMQICRDRCYPPIQVIFRCVQTPDGDVYVILIPGRKMGFPHAVKKNNELLFFIRTGSITKASTYDELKILFEEKIEGEEKIEMEPPFKLFEEDIPIFDFKMMPKKIEDIIPLRNETLNFLMGNRPSGVAIGEFRPLQNGFVFEGKTEFGLRALFLDKSGMMNYRESISDSVNIERLIVIVGYMFSLSKRIYEKYGYTDHVFLKAMLNNIKGFMLTTSPGRDILPHKSEEKTFTVERNYLIGQNPETTAVTESIVSEICRGFGFLIDDDILHSHVVEVIKKLRI